MLSRLNRSQSLISTCFFVLAAWIWHENVDAASLQLSWADNSQNEDGFDIERKTGNGGAFLALTTIPANQSSYTDPNLSNGTIYCYRVRAFNKAGGSPYSNEACATTAASAPTTPPPTANTISTNIANGATLSGSSVIWTAVPLPVFRFGSNFLSMALLARRSSNPRINSMVILREFSIQRPSQTAPIN